MKNIFAISVLFILLLLSCEEPPVVFNGPQPEGVVNRTSIDMIYHGTFLCDSDSAIVKVKNRIVYKEKAFAFSMTQEEIMETEGLDLIGDEIIVADWPEPLPATVTDSLVYSEIVLKDTLFNLGPDQVLKFYKGHLILNKKITNEKWEVAILSLDDDLNLRYSIAEMPTDLEKLNKITPVKDISTEDQEQILLSPTYLEFEEILRQQLIFEECDLFKRISSQLQI